MDLKCAMRISAGALLLFAMGSLRVAEAAPPIDACSLLTTAEVSAVVGASVGGGTPLFPTDTRVCHWRTTEFKIQVQLFLKDAQAFAHAKMAFPGKVVVSTSGIGDDAVYTSGGGAPAVLSVKKGDVSFDVHVLKYRLSDEKIKAMEKHLASEVLARL